MQQEGKTAIWGGIKEEFLSLDRGIADVWDEIGNFPEKNQVQTELTKTLLLFLQNAHQKEEKRKKEIEREVGEILEKCGGVCDRMGGSQEGKVESFKSHQHILNLVDRKQEAQRLLSTLTAELEKRITERSSLLLSISQLSEELQIERGEGDGEEDVSDKKLLELKEEIRKLQEVKAEILSELKTVVKDIKGLWKELGHDYTGNKQEEEIAQMQLPPTPSSLVLVEKEREKLKQTKSDRVEQIKMYAEKIVPLWEKLSVTEEERKRFFCTESGVTLGVVEACRKEYENKEKEWEERMGEVIQEKQQKLQGLFDIARFSDVRREQYESAFTTFISDDVVQQLDLDIEDVKELYKTMKPLLPAIQKFHALIEASGELEKSRSDPTRLRQRNAHDVLKREEMLQKQIKQLPTLEIDLEKKVKKWEETQQMEFELDGERFLDFLNFRREAEAEKKESLLRAKQLKKAGSSAPPPAKDLKRKAASTHSTQQPLRKRPSIAPSQSRANKVLGERKPLQENRSGKTLTAPSSTLKSKGTTHKDTPRPSKTITSMDKRVTRGSSAAASTRSTRPLKGVGQLDTPRPNNKIQTVPGYANQASRPQQKPLKKAEPLFPADENKKPTTAKRATSTATKPLTTRKRV